MERSVMKNLKMSLISNIRAVFPLNPDFDALASKRATVPFADDVIEALNALSAAILKDKRSRLYPDAITFAFFIRKSNLIALKNNCQLSTVNCQFRLGRGLIFHIAPSNVPINFGYSMVAGLLAGNNNIVRVSNKDFPQVDLIAELMNNVYKDGFDALGRVALVRYDHNDSSATDYFSSVCSARVIWGGDATIAKIRQSVLPPRSFDVCFADRYSLAILNADKLVDENDINKLAEGFYNDTYLFDQNACSAPHLVVWTGSNDNIKKAKELFWNAVHSVVLAKKYQFQAVMAVDKLTAMYKQSVAMDVTSEQTEDNLLRRVEIKSLADNIDEYRCACGYFTEYNASSIDELDSIIKNKYQTLAYYGFEKSELEKFVLDNQLRGIDRIVPIGHTTDFDLVWDGYDLIRTLSRVESVK